MAAKRRIKKINIKASKIKEERKRMIIKHIDNEMKGKKVAKIKNNIENLRKNGGGVKEEMFWEFRRKMKGTNEEKPHVMKNKEGKMEEDPDKIKEMFEEFYTNLFEKRDIKEEIVTKVEKQLSEIMKKGEEQNAITFTQEEVKKEIKQLKNKYNNKTQQAYHVQEVSCVA